MRTLVLFGSIACVVLLSYQPVHACTCAAMTVEEQFAAAEHVFMAHVIGASLPSRARIEVGEPSDRILFSGDPVEILFCPVTDYKGRSAALPKLFTVASGASCGIEVVLGAQYVFFADRKGHVGLCDGTARIDQDPQTWRETAAKLAALSQRKATAPGRP
jgi:hypothetical protein